MIEEEIIRRYFRSQARDDLILGIGDDAALTRPATGTVLVSCMDTLVEGVHFFADASAESLGHKLLAVNLSDLAAMGADPHWAMLALTLPASCSAGWLDAFSQGLNQLAGQYGMSLIGGDTTKGPLCMTLHAQGSIPDDLTLRRSGARPDDDLWVSGVLGAAGFAVLQRKQQNQRQYIKSLNPKEQQSIQQALDFPQPRVALGKALRTIAHSAIDLSDGLIQDLGRILQQSGPLGARLDLLSLPVHPVLSRHLPFHKAVRLSLGQGDDYELCFSAAPLQRENILALGHRMGIRLTRIGCICKIPGIVPIDPSHISILEALCGYQHQWKASDIHDQSKSGF